MERYDYGLSFMVAVNAAVFVAFLLTLLRPSKRREWGGFGVVAAFLVALFAEMYGFPLTIYLLAAAFAAVPSRIPSPTRAATSSPGSSGSPVGRGCSCSPAGCSAVSAC